MRFPIGYLAVLTVATSPAWAISGGSAKVCDVRDYGAKGDGATMDTAAIQLAIDACAANAGGGIVRLGGGGTFLSGPLELRSHIRLDLEGRSTLLAQHARLSAAGGNTTPTMVTAANVEDIAITGSGVIDGNKHSAAGEVEEAPHAVDFLGVKNGRIEGVTVLNSETIVITLSRDIRVSNVRIHSPEVSRLLGVGVTDSSHLAFDHVHTSVGGYGLVFSTATSAITERKDFANDDVRIVDCTFQNGDGLAVESGRDIRAEHLRFTGGAKGVSVFAKQASVHDVSFSDVKMFGVKKPIVMEAAPPVAMTRLQITNLNSVGAKSAGSIAGSATSPITALALKDVSIEAAAGLSIENAQGSFDGVIVKVEEGQGLLIAASANVERN